MNKVVFWFKKHKITASILVLALLWAAWFHPPFKPTDPNNPFFSEKLFRMRDYGSQKGVRELRDKVLPKLFPLGTSKEYVDLMLVERGGAQLDNHTGDFEGYYIYRYRPIYLLLTPDGLNIMVYYDKNNKVQAIHFAGRLIAEDGFKAIPAPHHAK